jgi:heat shock protein HslJ
LSAAEYRFPKYHFHSSAWEPFVPPSVNRLHILQEKTVKKYIPFLLALTMILSACTSRADSLTGTWKLVSYGPTESMTAALPDVDASLTFAEDGTVSADSGCNSLGGKYTHEGDQVTFTDMAATLMACEEARMAQESAVFQVLSGTAQFEMEDQTLTISKNGMALVFTSVPAE